MDSLFVELVHLVLGNRPTGRYGVTFLAVLGYPRFCSRMGTYIVARLWRAG